MADSQDSVTPKAGGNQVGKQILAASEALRKAKTSTSDRYVMLPNGKIVKVTL